MVSIYLLNISLNWSTCEKRLIRCVSKKRQERIRKNNVAINKKALLIGALLTRSLVKAKLNIKNNDQRYSNELNHKPYLINNSKFKFSLSYSEDYVCCCIGNDNELGIDIEVLNKAPLSIMKFAFTNSEIQYVNQNKSYVDERFYEIWTKKEAYGKKIGRGLIYDLKSTNTLDKSLNIKTVKVFPDIILSFCFDKIDKIEIKRISEKEIIDSFFYD